MEVRNISTTKKLIIIQLVTAISVLVLSLIGFIVSDIYQYKELKLRNLLGVANIIGTNSSSAIIFYDNIAGQELLDDLRYQPDIIAGTIFLSEGQVFVHYGQKSPNSFIDFKKLDGKNYYYEGEKLVACVDIMNDDRRIGSVCLVSKLSIVEEVLNDKVKIALVIFLLGIALTFLIAMLLQKYISEPVLNLASFMRNISNSGNYSVRLNDQSKDEVGILSREFDDLLTQIERRDKILIDRNNLLRNVLDNIADGVLLVEPDGKIIMSNPTSDQLAGIPLEGIDLFHFLSRLEVRDNSGRTLALDELPLMVSIRERRIVKEEVLVYLPTNESRWLLTTAAPLYTKDGEIEGVVTILTDITWIKAVNQELEQRIAERTRQLTNTNNVLSDEIEKRMEAEKKLEIRAVELERSNRDLQQFAYVASHDLQEPLRMIASFAQLLEKRYKNKLDDSANEYIHFITDGASRMKRLIDDLLSFSRVTSKAKPFSVCDLRKVINTVLLNIQELIEEKKAKVSIKSQLPVIVADDIQMMQLFQNLITNGIKFQPPGQTPEVSIDVTEKDLHWEFSVKDNGIGINKEFEEKIFVIFQRLHNQKSYPGSGIGLSICKKIVERHRGTIWIKSEEGKGTTFFFTISKKLPVEGTENE